MKQQKHNPKNQSILGANPNQNKENINTYRAKKGKRKYDEEDGINSDIIGGFIDETGEIPYHPEDDDEDF